MVPVERGPDAAETAATPCVVLDAVLVESAIFGPLAYTSIASTRPVWLAFIRVTALGLKAPAPPVASFAYRTHTSM